MPPSSAPGLTDCSGIGRDMTPRLGVTVVDQLGHVLELVVAAEPAAVVDDVGPHQAGAHHGAARRVGRLHPQAGHRVGVHPGGALLIGRLVRRREVLPLWPGRGGEGRAGEGSDS